MTYDHSKRRLKILLISQGDISSEKTWSGIPQSMAKQLEGSVSVVELKSVSTIVQAIDRHLHSIIIKITKTRAKGPIRFHIQDTMWVSRLLGLAVWYKAKRQHVDVILGLSCTNYVAYLPKGIPVILVTGSTFSAIAKTPGYLDYSQCPKAMIKHYEATERNARERVDQYVVPSSTGEQDLRIWANVPGYKICVVPYGPNIDEQLARATRSIAKVSMTRCDLLFIGNDWDRKGGPIAVEVTNALCQRNISAHLHIVGPKRSPDPSCPFTFYGHLSKKTDINKIFELYSSAFMLILPSKSELFGVVFREAACFGLPSIAFDAGGVPEAVNNGISGILMSENASHQQFANEIENLWNNNQNYEKLRLSSASFYDEHCSWTRWLGSMLEIMTASHTVDRSTTSEERCT